MEIVTEGSLESISRPASTTSDTGRGCSRKAKKAAPQTLSSLELLPPEVSNFSGIPGELFSALEGDVEVEDYEEDDIDEDSNDDSEYSLSADDVVESDNQVLHASEEQSLVITSDRSRSAGHYSCHSNSPHSDGKKSVEPLGLEEGEQIDPQIREGLEKIKKLDKILSEKIKKEKEVKNQRHLMEKMWKEQLQQKLSKTPEGVKDNTLIGATLLALELGNEESLGSSRDDPVTPVFPTQPLNTEELQRNQASSLSGSSTGRSTLADSASESSTTGRQKRNSSKRSNRFRQEGDNGGNGRRGSHKDKHRGQDFIKRNKQLAADAANVIPMTEEEKARLEQLLVDDNVDNLMHENPFDASNLSMTSGIGFRPDEESARTLADIEEKLQALVPANELELFSSRALTYTPLTENSEYAASVHSKASENVLDYLDNIDIGERVLREEKDARDMHHRLMSIEYELEKLKQLSEDETENKLSQELLRKLLGESSRTTSRSTTIGQAVVSSLSNPRHCAIDQAPDITPRPLSSIADVTGKEGSHGGTPSTLRTVSTLSDITIPTEEVNTPRTITSADYT